MRSGAGGVVLAGVATAGGVLWPPLAAPTAAPLAAGAAGAAAGALALGAQAIPTSVTRAI
jgi:hypothetical protein